MRSTSRKIYGACTAALVIGLSLASTPGMAQSAWHGGDGNYRVQDNNGSGNYHSGGAYNGGGYHRSYNNGGYNNHRYPNGGAYNGGYYHGGYHNGGYYNGYGLAAPAIGLGLLGGAIAATQSQNSGSYGAESEIAPQEGPGDPVAYCMSQYRSYDPRSGTYLGYDGLRHPCP